MLEKEIPNTKEGNEKYNMCFVKQYNLKAVEIKKIVERHWNLLSLDKELESILPKKPKSIFQKAPNLKQKLVHTCNTNNVKKGRPI